MEAEREEEENFDVGGEKERFMNAAAAVDGGSFIDVVVIVFVFVSPVPATTLSTVPRDSSTPRGGRTNAIDDDDDDDELLAPPKNDAEAATTG